MSLHPYNIAKYKNKPDAFTFVSKGIKDVKKVIQITATDLPNVYNLAMGDEISGEIDYTNRTNNGDTGRVMETIAHIILQYTATNPDRSVFVAGNTPAKTRLYQMYLSNNLQSVETVFEVYGLMAGTSFEVFQKNKNFSGFLVRRR